MKAAMLRALAFVLLAWCGIGEVHAVGPAYPACKTANTSDGIPGTTPSRECAYASVRAYLEYYRTYRGGTPYTMCGPYQLADPQPWPDHLAGAVEGWTQSAIHGGNCPADTSDYTKETYPSGVDCNTAGDVWDAATGTCASGGPTDEECQAINTQPGFIGVGLISRSFSSKCMANGCEFGAVGGSVTTDAGTGSQVTTGQFEWTGACASTPPPEAPEPETVKIENIPPQTCIPGTLPQMCVNNDGEHCVAASTGKQLCWRPGETGTKFSGDTAQKRVAGTNPATPPTPPEGETFTQGGSVTATATDDTTAVTTTTTNFKTAGGTEAGEIDQGEPDDGSGSPNDGGEDDPGSVTGGEGCDTAPVVQGDPILANIVLQTWGTRCAAESANAVTSTGEIGDCASPWTISGPEGDANVQKLKALRAEICGGDGNANGQPDWTEGEQPAVPGEGEPVPGDVPGPPTDLPVSTSMLDVGGLLGGTATCPELGVLDFGEFGTFDLNSEPYWCDLVTLMRAIVLLMAAFTAIKILMGGN